MIKKNFLYLLESFCFNYIWKLQYKTANKSDKNYFQATYTEVESTMPTVRVGGKFFGIHKNQGIEPIEPHNERRKY